MSKENHTEHKKRKHLPIPASISEPCIEFSGNREVLIEGSRGVLEYTPETVRINMPGMILSVYGRELNLRCISASALIVEGFMTGVEFTV